MYFFHFTVKNNVKLMGPITYGMKFSIYHLLQLAWFFYRLLMSQVQVIFLRHTVIRAATQAAKGCQIPQVMVLCQCWRSPRSYQSQHLSLLKTTEGPTSP